VHYLLTHPAQKKLLKGMNSQETTMASKAVSKPKLIYVE